MPETITKGTDPTNPPKLRGKLCHEDKTQGFPVRLYQNGRDRFTVQYGLQVREGLDYTRAAAEFGSCLMHALACNGLLDNRRKGER